MGAQMSQMLTSAGALAIWAGRALSPAPSRRKRRLEELDDDDDDGDECDGEDDDGRHGQFHQLMHTPKKRKLRSTMDYIYDTMFQRGEGSDVTLHALGSKYRLHRIYLSQSPFFKSMFSSNWREATQKEIDIHVVDANITAAGLNTALGSLYHDEIQLKPSEIVSVVAAASLLQLDGLLQQCSAVMNGCINLHTAIAFMEAAGLYHLTEVQQRCQLWLETNLMTHLMEQPHFLRQLSTQTMSRLVSSPRLLVYQTEFSLYIVLKLWLYLKLEESGDSDGQSADIFAAHKYFQQRTDRQPVLETEEGRPFRQPFEQLRLSHLVSHPLDLDVLLKDRVVPSGWLQSVFQRQWSRLLRLDQGLQSADWTDSVTQEMFDCHAMRCGRIIADRQRCTWRWTGFNFGLDLVMVYSKSRISVKRMTKQDSSAVLVSLATQRSIVYTVSVCCLDEQRMPAKTQASGRQTTQLAPNQERVVLNLEAGFSHPMYVCWAVMVGTEPPAG